MQAIQLLFDQKVEGCALAGGTCLAGFYAGHRRSDDIDLFVNSSVSFRAALISAKNLESFGIRLSQETTSAHHYRAVCEFDGHAFTVDIAHDENLFRVGRFVTLPSGIVVATLETLLKRKIATLVSRCGEKALYGVQWLVGQFPQVQMDDWFAMGREIDGGVNAESMLASVVGSPLRQVACDFSTDPNRSSKEIFDQIVRFRDRLILDLVQFLKNEPPPPLARLVKKLRRKATKGKGR